MNTRADVRLRSSRAIACTIAMILAATGCAADTVATPSASATVTPPTASPDATPSPSPPPSAPAPTVQPASPTPTPEPAGPSILDLLAADPPPDFVSTISCEGSIGESDPVAIVRLRSPDDDVFVDPTLRNYADIAAPRTVCTFGGLWPQSLIDPRHVVISVEESALYAVVELPEVRYRWFRLPVTEGSSASLIAVAPRLDAVTWSRHATDASLARQILMTDASGDHVLADLPAMEGGRCGSPLDSSPGAFARTGESYYLLDQLLPRVNVLVVGRGPDVGLTLYPPDEGWNDASRPLFPVWSPTSETLYYRVGADVMRWRPGSDPEVFLSDTPWSRPTFTPDGNYLAYGTDDGVFLVDMTRAPAPRLIRADAGLPVFLNSAQLWFKLSDTGGCVTGETKERIYDLRDGSDASSIIDQVLHVWPATSSNH